jgi:hypothetical protein
MSWLAVAGAVFLIGLVLVWENVVGPFGWILEGQQ